MTGYDRPRRATPKPSPSRRTSSPPWPTATRSAIASPSPQCPWLPRASSRRWNGWRARSQAPAASAREGRISPDQWQKIFPENKQLSLRDQRARLAILQRGERCISAAANADALRSCMREQRTAMQQQRRQYMQAMRALFERNGIQMPELGKGPGGKGGGV